MNVLACDPGTTESGVVLWDGYRVLEAHGKMRNAELVSLLQRLEPLRYLPCHVVIERFEARGMAISDDSIETMLWSGRFYQAALRQTGAHWLKRSEVKSHLCGSQKAKDPNIRAALCDRFGRPGTTKNRGVLFGVKEDAWAALAVAVTFHDKQGEKR